MGKMKESVTSARAVVGVSEVHFLKHANGVEPTISATLFDGTSTTDWFSVATIKGSVEVNQDNMSITTVHIDQSNTPIGISTEPGDFAISAQFPSMVSDELAKWMDKDNAKIVIEDSRGVKKDGYGYEFNADITACVLAIKTQTGDWMVFPNTQGAVAFGKEDNVWMLKFDGQVLGASNAANKDVYVFADAHTSSSAE